LGPMHNEAAGCREIRQIVVTNTDRDFVHEIWDFHGRWISCQKTAFSLLVCPVFGSMLWYTK